MKPAEIREKTTNELTKFAVELHSDVCQLKFKLGSGQLKQTADVKKKKRDLARVKTVLRERENEA